MKITRVPSSKYLKFTPQGEKEKRLIRKFPGLVSIGLEFYCANKPHVVTNLVKRFQSKKCTIEMDPVVAEMVNNKFKLKEIPASFKFFTEPLRHQLISLRFLYTVGSAGLLLEPGMGKTKIILDYIALMGFKKSVIICPKALLFVWEDEVATHRPDKSIYVIKSTNWESEEEEINKADIVVVNYTKASMLKGRLLNLETDFIAVDEFLIKDPTTDRTKDITELGYDVDYKVGASGTLINNTPLDMFAPVRFVEPSLVGYQFAKFRDEYAVTVKKDDRSFIVGFRRKDEAKEILESCSIVMTKDEWLDLPPKKFKNIIVQMSDEQRRVYQELAGNYITSIGDDYVEVDNPLTVLCKLNQISNGMLYISNELSSEENEFLSGKTKGKKARKVHFFQEQPKAVRLIKLLKNELVNRRVIIWYNLSGERSVIESYLKTAGIEFLTIAGGEKDTGGKVKEFNRNQSIGALLCQSKAVNYGITVLGTSADDLEEDGIEILPNIDTEIYTQIFYSMSYSLETYLQQQDRIHRIGQTHECEYYHLISNSEIEYAIVDALETKKKLREEMLVDIVNQKRFALLDESFIVERNSAELSPILSERGGT